MNAEFFSKGDSVNVEPADDICHEFTGTVVGFRNGNVIVEDQDGDCWEVDAEQLSFCSDQYMHWHSVKSW